MKKLYAMLAIIGIAALGAGTALADNQSNCTGNSCNVSGGNGTGGAGGAGGAGGYVKDSANVGIGGGAFSKTLSPEQNQLQGQEQLQGQGQGQGQIQGLVGLGSGNKTSIRIDAPVIPTSTTLKNTPDISLGGLYPSSPCMGTSNIGGSGPGFSLGFGTSWKDDDCGYRETARLFGVNTPDGIAVLCSSEYAKAAPSCQKAAAAKKAAAEAPVVAQQADKRKVSGQKEAAPQVVASANPTECLTDEFMARRLGKAVCK